MWEPQRSQPYGPSHPVTEIALPFFLPVNTTLFPAGGVGWAGQETATSKT
jgi:hypothetical protein